MPGKNTLREQRRHKRAERQRRTRRILGGIILFSILFIAIIIFTSWFRNNQAQKIANATATVQIATNSVYTATAIVLQTANANAQATLEAIASTVKPMTFTGVPTDTVKLDSGLQYKDLVVGTGQETKTGNLVSVHYTGWLTDGTKFDSSVDRGQPFEFSAGAGNVIKGWDDGVVGMRIGGYRILVIPPNMAYGPQGQGSIPANATLVFEIVLLNIK
jgi:FKBP-type peptidyl-prolyl cis-trans isomerase